MDVGSLRSVFRLLDRDLSDDAIVGLASGFRFQDRLPRSISRVPEYCSDPQLLSS